MKRGLCWAAGAAAVSFLLLRYAGEVAEGVRSGLESCGNLLIPSLFPFMVLAAVIGATPAGRGLSRLTGAALHTVTGLPRSLGAVFLMSFLGGFPVGARMLSQGLEQGDFDKDTVERALCCCVNAGPSFLVTAVGLGILGNRRLGLLLLGAQILSSFCIAAIQFRGRRSPLADKPKGACLKETGVDPDAFVEAVRGAASGMFGICAFMILFSALTALLQASGILPLASAYLAAFFPGLGQPFFSGLLSGMLEVTNGCIAAGGLTGQYRVLLCAFLVSFSSLSIIFQIKSCFLRPLSFGKFYGSRLLHGCFTTVFTALGLRWLPAETLSAAMLTGAPLAVVQPNMLAASVCLMAMCSILLLSPPGKGRKRSRC